MNDTIVKVTPNDLDLLFQGKKNEILVSRKQWELAEHVKWVQVPGIFSSILVL